MAKFKCKLCGYIHEGELNDYYECPLCHAPATKFEKFSIFCFHPLKTLESGGFLH